MRKSLSLLLIVSATVLGSCQKKKADIEVFIENVALSEKKLQGYRAETVIRDGLVAVYECTTEFRVDRSSDPLRTWTTETVTRLNPEISGDGDETFVTEQRIINTTGTAQDLYVNGLLTVGQCVIPDYFLTFRLAKEYFESYEIKKAAEKQTLTGIIRDDKIDSFFSIDVTDALQALKISILTENSQLKCFQAEYLGKSGLPVSTIIDYNYDLVTVVH